jgi:type I restriction enzyme S subunit
LNEQRRIVARIDELFAEIAEGEAALERARQGLDTWRRALLKAAVTGELTREWRAKNAPNETGTDLLNRILAERRAAWERAEFSKLKAKGRTPKDDTWKTRYVEPPLPDTSDLPNLPNGWIWASVDQLAWLVQYGSSAKCSGDSSGVPVLRMGNIQDGSFDLTSLKYLPSEHSEFPDLLLDEGDVLFNRTNSPELVGKTAVYDGAKRPCSFASYLIRLKLCRVRSLYFAYFVNSAFGRAWVASVRSQQVGQANVSGGKLKDLRVPIPPEHEQDEIIRLVEDSFEASKDVGDDRTIWEGAAMLRQSILSAAFSGKLVPQDPADEPASVLLERLLAAKASAEPQGRSARPRLATPRVPRRRGASGDPAASAGHE